MSDQVDPEAEIRRLRGKLVKWPKIEELPDQVDALDAILVDYGRFMQRNSPERADAVRAQFRETKAKLSALLVEARIEQVMQDFMALSWEFDQIDEKDLIDWRLRQLKELEKQREATE